MDGMTEVSGRDLETRKPAPATRMRGREPVIQREVPEGQAAAAGFFQVRTGAFVTRPFLMAEAATRM